MLKQLCENNVRIILHLFYKNLFFFNNIKHIKLKIIENYTIFKINARNNKLIQQDKQDQRMRNGRFKMKNKWKKCKYQEGLKY